MARLRLGLIGSGVIAHRHVKRIVHRSDVSIVGIADPNIEAIARLKSSIICIEDVPVFSSMEELLSGVALDAVIIATPHFLHANHACLALQAGIHVMLEKPLAMTSEEGRAIISARDVANKVLLVAYQRRYNAMYRWVRDSIASGTIGELQFVHGLLGDDTISRLDDSWHFSVEHSGGGHPFDSGGHLLDFILYASRLEPARVKYFESNLGLPVDVNSSMSLEFVGGALASVALVGNAPGRWIEEIDFWGSRGHISMRTSNYTGPLYPAITLTDFDSRVHRIEDIPAHVEPDDNFFDAIAGRDVVHSPAEAGLNVLLLTEAARYSARCGGEAQIDYVEEI